MKSILNYLYNNYSDQKILKICDENSIGALLYRKQYNNYRRFNPIFKKAWIRQKYQNECYLNQFSMIQSMCDEINIKIIPLKGIWLLQHIYQDDIAIRKLSDIDLYINKPDLNQFDQILKKLGFTIRQSQKWWGNNFKSEYLKTVNGLEVIIEVHTKLFYHLDNPNYQFLNSLEGKLVHLCGHMALQHNFSNFYWILDIYYICKLKENQINWPMVTKIAKQLQLTNSVQLSLKLIHQYFNINFSQEIQHIYKLNSSKWCDHYLNQDFLFDNSHHGFNYQLMKLATRDSLSLTIKYNMFWILQKLSGQQV